MPHNVVVLGNNEIVDCDTALFVEGEEVFRLRDSTREDKLIVDFDLRDSDGNRIAKIASSSVVYVAPGYSYKNTMTSHKTRVAEVKDEATDTPIAYVEEQTPGRIKVTGTFWVNGYHVEITEEGLNAGGIYMSGNHIEGFGKAIELKRGSFMIGTH